MLATFSLLLAFHGKNPCLPPTLAHRTGRERCWVQFEVDARKTLCVSHSGWLRWLSSARPGRVCESVQDGWKAFTPLRNSAKDPLKKEVRFIQSITSYSRGNPEERSLTKITDASWQMIEKTREKTSELLRPHDPHGILRSLLLSEGVGQGPLAMFRRLGFVHLVSATGIHLYALARGCDWIIRGLCLYLEIPIVFGLWFSRLTSFGLCGSVWLLCGARMGMLRPWIVLFMRGLARLLGFRWQKGSPLFLALAIDLGVAFCRGWAGQGAGFHSGRWVYALAVGGGLFWSESFHNSHLGLALGSWLLVALWEVWETGLVAMATPLFSWITLPLTCLCAYPLLVVCVVLNETGFETWAASGIRFLSWLLSFLILNLSELAMAVGNLWIIPRKTFLAGLLFSSLFVVVRPLIRKEWKFSILALSVLVLARVGLGFFPASKLDIAARRVEQLDVGQGDAALVLGPRPGLIDSGSKNALSDDAWIRILAEREIQTLSWAAVTHLDEDHSGGLKRLARLLPIRCIATPSAELQTQRGNLYAKTFLALGVQVQDLASNCVPYPTFSTRSGDLHTSHHANENMGAVWVPLQSGGFYLSAGDAGAQDEIAIGKWAARLAERKEGSRILKVSHHGSRFSSSPGFLEAVHPTEAWISVGVNNRYGHPTTQVLGKLERRGILVRRTDRDGILAIE